MAIAASGAVSLADLRTEFVGGSAAISLGDLYRGGSNIRAKAGNNTATNLAANVPTSGAIDFADFYSTAKGFRKTYSSGATDQDASSVFGDDYGVDYPKEIVIDSGVELGATSTSQEALQIDSGLSGGLTITNNGTLSGAGGAAGSDGGDAFQADVACTFVNNGTVRAGGGGGGTGGTGGQGSTTTTGWGSWDGFHYVFNPCSANRYYYHDTGAMAPGPYAYWRWSCAAPLPDGRSYNGLGPYQTGSYQYEREGQSNNPYYGSPRQIVSNRYYYWGVRRRQQTTTTNYHSGGSGGSGGVGQGYNQSTGSGSAGSAGGTNAGAGGSGGGGGSFGNSGSTGSTGANGNFTNGSSGSGGGAAGKYIRGLSNVTFTNNGTVQGGTA